MAPTQIKGLYKIIFAKHFKGHVEVSALIYLHNISNVRHTILFLFFLQNIQYNAYRKYTYKTVQYKEQNVTHCAKRIASVQTM